MARILETILPESIRNEGLLFVPQVLEDQMCGKLDREFPVRPDEGEDPASARTYAFDVARRLYKTFSESLTQANYKVVTRKFVVNLLDNALGWNFDRGQSLACSDIPFLLPPFSRRDKERRGRGGGGCLSQTLRLCTKIISRSTRKRKSPNSENTAPCAWCWRYSGMTIDKL